MEKQNIKNEIEKYIVDLQTEIHHPILKRDLGEVKLKNATVFCILLPLLSNEQWTDSVYQASIAVGAVHAAFDAHDDIDKLNASTSNQQFKVLSGDYYSGIHYRLLAATADFDFIRSLSIAIGKINETKTNFHQQSPESPTELIEAIRIIETACICQFYETYGFAKYKAVVSSALPLIILQGVKNKCREQLNQVIVDWNLSTTMIDEAIQILQKDLLDALEESIFLSSFIKSKVEHMATTLFDKNGEDRSEDE